MKNNMEKNEINKRQKIKLFIWEIIKYFITVLNTIAAFASILGLIFSIVSKEKVAMALYIAAAVFLVIVLLTIKVVQRSAENDKLKEVNKYAKGFHDILHLIRDDYGELMEAIREESYRSPSHFRKEITGNLMKMMDILSQNLSEATGYSARACIKTFDFIRDGETDRNKMKIITLARSGQQSVNNMLSEHYKPVPLNENTDFEFIFNISEGYVEQRTHFFLVDDLFEYSKKNEYKNSNPKWKRYYRTTIVMPIRYLMNPGDNDNEDDIPQYDIIGCLCIDSKKQNLFAIEKRGFIIEYLKGIADILYVYLSECIDYHDYLKEGGYNG